jgi:hypothetical protein
MSTVSALGAAALLVSVAFAFCTWERWLGGGRRHELAWTQALVLFALAAAAYWAAGLAGWQGWEFRAFYLFGAIVNVPYLALGTVYLLGGEDIGRVVHRWLHVAAAFCAGVLITAQFRHPLPSAGLPEGRDVFGIAPRVMAAVGSGLGATVIIVGAVVSAGKLLIVGRRPAAGPTPSISPRRLALTNILIAAGAIVLSLDGTLFTGSEREVGFGVLLVIGIVVLFSGFLVSGTAPRPATEPASVLQGATDVSLPAGQNTEGSGSGSAGSFYEELVEISRSEEFSRN